MDVDSMGEKTIVNVIKLFIENTILREKLLYASEHDGLTGLYNKGKYLSMVEQEFLKMESIAIFNFDVNDLKVINDTYGHEAGDKLLIKAPYDFAELFKQADELMYEDKKLKKGEREIR